MSAFHEKRIRSMADVIGTARGELNAAGLNGRKEMETVLGVVSQFDLGA